MNYSKPKIISGTENERVVAYCSDSDGKNIYAKGYSGYKYLEGTEGETGDVCEYNHPKIKDRVGAVREGYCEENKYKTFLSTCGRGFICRNGACIEGDKDSSICSDTDGGQDFNKRGQVYGYGGSGMDECWISNNADPELDGAYTNECNGTNCYVYEYYCNGDSKEYQISSCSICQNGACLK